MKRMGDGGAFSTVVIGGGTAGAALAGTLVEAGEEVLVLEAGPDYGAGAAGRWPEDLLDASALPSSHQAGHVTRHGDRVIPLERARVIGGCSSHNGCAAIWGHAADYEAWEKLGNPGWGTAALAPAFARASERLRVKAYDEGDITPFHRACLDAAATLGWPRSNDLNDLDEDEGIAPFPVNIVDGVRWNAALAYLDPVRSSPLLEIADEMLVERVVVEDGRATHVVARSKEGEVTIACDRVVVCAGTYDSPAILLRSGIGPAAELSSLGIGVTVDLPGVGRGLQDHPMVVLRYAGTPELERRMSEASGWIPEEQTLAKLRSTSCTEAFDVHVAPIGGALPDGGWHWEITVACMTPRSRGTVRLADRDPATLPEIDVSFLSDPDGHDRQVLTDGVALARALAGAPGLLELLGKELPTEVDDLDRSVTHYYHAVGTCAMGPEPANGSVVDAAGAVHGIRGLYVADCSVVPVLPRANTNLPAVVIGERVAELMLSRESRARRDPEPVKMGQGDAS